MEVTFFSVNSDVGLKKFDEYLLSHSYITGYQASKDDITVHATLSEAPSSEYVNVSRWYNHIEPLLRISGVSGEDSGVITEGFTPLRNLWQLHLLLTQRNNNSKLHWDHYKIQRSSQAVV